VAQRSPISTITAEIEHFSALLLQHFSFAHPFVWQAPLLTRPPSLYPIGTGSSAIRPSIAPNRRRVRLLTS